MFIGHHAVAFAAKRCAPRTSLGVLFAAAMLLDFLWAPFLLLGWERMRVDPGNTAFTPLSFDSYPISHSLVMSAAWSVLFAGGYWAITRYRTGAIVTGLVVLSHWVLDVLTHRADMPLAPGLSTRVGLGLWNSVAGTVLVEGAMFAAAVWLYCRTVRPIDRTSRISFWAFITFLVLLYAVNALGPPPPSSQAVAWVTFTGWLLPLWAAWADRHRAPTTTG